MADLLACFCLADFFLPLFLATVFFFGDFLAAFRFFVAETFFFLSVDFLCAADFFLGERFGRDFFLLASLLLPAAIFLPLAKILPQFSEYFSVAPTRAIDIFGKLHPDETMALNGAVAFYIEISQACQHPHPSADGARAGRY